MGSDLSHHNVGERNGGSSRRARLTSGTYGVVSGSSKKDIQSWSEICHCPLDCWHKIAKPLGFLDLPLTCSGKLHKDCTKSFCINRQGILHVRGDSMFSFHKRSKLVKMAAHLEYNYLPAQLSALYYYHVRSIVCMRDSIIVLFLSRARDCQFAVLDLKRDKYLGVFGTQSGIISPELLYGDISMDLSKFIIRMPYTHQPERVDDDVDTVWYHLVVFNIESRRRLADIDLRTAVCLFAFNPSVCWHIVTITNFSWAPSPVSQNSICHINIDSWDVGTVNNSVSSEHHLLRLDTQLRDLQYTRDGAFVVLSLAETRCACSGDRRSTQPISCTITVLCSQSLAVLRCFDYLRATCALHLCPFNYTPQQSMCGTRLVFVTDTGSRTGGSVLTVIRLPVTVNLQGLCRALIVQLLPASVIPHLPLPPRIIKYLQFTPS